MRVLCGLVAKSFLVIVLVFSGVALARDYRITTDGKPTYFDLDLTKVAVSFVPSVLSAERDGFLSSLPAVDARPIERYEAPLNMTMVRLRAGSDEKAVLATLAALEASPLVDWSAPVLVFDKLEHVPTPRLYVQFSPMVSSSAVQSLLAQHGLTLIRRCDDWAKGVVYVQRGKGSGVESLDVANALLADNGVEWAVPDFNREVSPFTNDTYYNNQWYLYQASRHDIHAPEAWAITTGDTSVVISICDVGVQIAHPDLAAKIVTGYDAVTGGSDPTPNTTYADDGHGTCCAGIADAVTNNSIGVAGVAYNCRLLGTRMGYISFGGSGIQTNDTWIINCINYSRDHAKVESDSWGGGSSSSAVNTALQNAKNAGLTILFSSGNSNSAVAWPATQASVISVGATNESDYRCSPTDWGSGQGSNYGASLDVVAPGNNQYCTDDSRAGAGFDPNSAYYTSFAGTSGACPVAAGVCALIISRNHSLIPDSVQAILQRTANDLVGRPSEDTPGWDQYMGWGRVNAGAAVAAAAGITVTSPNGNEVWYTGENHNITWSAAGVSGNIKIELNRTYPGGTWETIIASTGNTGSYAWTVTTPVSVALARVRITSVSNTSITDVSDANFTISAPFVNVTSPIGTESWVVGTLQNITWTSGGFTGNVTIELNRTYPSGTWESVVVGTTNSGTYAWTVTGPGSTLARIRVSSTNTPATNGVSANNFAIVMPTVTVTAPNGGEVWTIGIPQYITWLPVNFTTPVNIELNRTYPSGTWELLFSGTLNDSSELWTVSGPTTTQARIRVTNVVLPAVSDVSDNNFTIVGQPPTLIHDALADFAPGGGLAVARASSASGIASVSMYYRAVGTTPFTQIAFSFAAAPNYYSCSLAALAAGSYEYYVQAADLVNLTSNVPTGAPTTLYSFTAGGLCASELSYDDGSAEMFNYPGADSVDVQFAVQFGPVQSPFALCGARFAASRSIPDSIHTPVRVAVYLADGAGGLPGTLLGSYTKGSVGNVVGGLPLGTNWAQVIFRDISGNPLIINASQFYISVSNIQLGQLEAFGRDTSSANNHRSYVYDPCRSNWFSEDANDSLVTHPGNRLIRAQGFSLLPPTVVINRFGSDIKLLWSSTNAPRYNVYNASIPGGPFTFLQAVTDTFLTVSAADSMSTLKMFYQVQSATP